MVAKAAGPRWSTSSIGEAADTTPMELSVLGEHLTLCNGASAHLLAVRCGAQKMQGFVRAHLVSALVVVLTLIGIAWLVF